jgi:hypothetical protein
MEVTVPGWREGLCDAQVKAPHARVRDVDKRA